MRDLYNPAASTLKTITRDPLTFRTRDIKAGEDVKSIWDEIQGGRGYVLNPSSPTLKPRDIDDVAKSKFYNEADMLEDAVLFPEELINDSSVALYKGSKSETGRLVNSGPDWVRFINDLDIDEEDKYDEWTDGEKEDSHIEDGDSPSEGSDDIDNIDEEAWTDESSSEEHRVISGKTPDKACLTPYIGSSLSQIHSMRTS